MTSFLNNGLTQDGHASTTLDQNHILFERAQMCIPGGVNSPVRAFKSVGGIPRFFSKGQGAYVWDANGKKYIDMIGSWGAMILGHAHPSVLAAVQAVMQDGFSFGAPTQAEILLAEKIIALVPNMAMVRMVSSGTEATMSAIRLARGYTKKSFIIKFDGAYHGHVDALLVKAGSGLATFAQPSSQGILPDVAKHTLVLPYNDIPALEQAFAQYGDDIAAVIIEPVAGNMNLVPAHLSFLQALRKITQIHHSVLIFDEVMSGFRVALGGAQALYGVDADLICLGKVIGGGMPLAAFGGRRAIMECLSPIGGVYQAGTLSGNPVAVAAGLSTLALVEAPDFFTTLSANTGYWAKGMASIAQAHGLRACSLHVGGMFGFFMGLDVLPDHFVQVQKSDVAGFNKLFHACLARGLYLAPSCFEAGFISIQHSKNVLDEALNIFEDAVRAG